MPIKKMNLRNLLQIFYSTEKYRAKLLRRDVIEQIKKDNGKIGSGQSFYGPFWADAKDHAAGLKDLTIETYNRIEKSERRKNTYPILRDGFLSWWNEKRRWRNERFDIIPQTDSVNANFYEIDCVVKIENMFSVRIDESEKRLIYPYFSESPHVSLEMARVGISIIASSTSGFRSEEVRILDVRRGTAYGTIDAPLQGNERELFLSYYRRALADWSAIRDKLE